MTLASYDRLPTELRFYALGLMPKPSGSHIVTYL
jgi:hypothetical protein